MLLYFNYFRFFFNMMFYYLVYKLQKMSMWGNIINKWIWNYEYDIYFVKRRRLEEWIGNINI